MSLAVFVVLSIGLLVSAILVLYQKSAVHSALFLVLTFLFLAGLYLQLGAEFVAAVHVIVYAGAIMVLFLFVIMLLNLKGDIRGFVHGRRRQMVALFMGILVLALIVMSLGVLTSSPAASTAQTQGGAGGNEARLGNTQAVGVLLFSKYVLPFEIASVLLIVAMLGAVVLAKKDLR